MANKVTWIIVWFQHDHFKMNVNNGFEKGHIYATDLVTFKRHNLVCEQVIKSKYSEILSYQYNDRWVLLPNF